jgi:hypothetical protein
MHGDLQSEKKDAQSPFFWALYYIQWILTFIVHVPVFLPPISIKLVEIYSERKNRAEDVEIPKIKKSMRKKSVLEYPRPEDISFNLNEDVSASKHSRVASSKRPIITGNLF